jgi:hypothetical protein
MATGNFEGKTAHHPEIRRLFTRDYLLTSEWYHQRLRTKQQRDTALWQRHVDYLDAFIANPVNADELQRLSVPDRRAHAAAELARSTQPDYLKELIGTLGADPLGQLA